MPAAAPELDRIFHALADASRRQMLDRLARGPASVKELAAPFELALPSVLKHLQVLEAGGVVRSEKTGRVRTYRLEPAALEQVERWIAQRKSRWHERFDRLDELLRAEAKTPRKRGKR